MCMRRRRTPTPGAPRAHRCVVSRRRGPLLGDDDEHLGTRKGREAVLQGYVIVPFGHDRDARRAAADRDLAVPAGEVAPDPGQTLPPARIAKPADPLNQGGFQGRRVAPAGAEALALRRLERMTEPHPASATAITTTRRASLRRQWYACTATQPPVPACSTIF